LDRLPAKIHREKIFGHAKEPLKKIIERDFLLERAVFSHKILRRLSIEIYPKISQGLLKLVDRERSKLALVVFLEYFAESRSVLHH